VKNAIANDGPRMKRIRPAPQGRAYRYQRRIAHIELILAERGKSGSAVVHAAGGDTADGAKVRRRVPPAKTGSKAPAKKSAGKKKLAAK
jgi:large subunit ribosomal protein L22